VHEEENVMDDRRKLCGCCKLVFTTVPANRPPTIAVPFWAQATAKGVVCGEDNTGHIEVSAQGLVPLGVYTVWFLTDKGTFPAAPTNAAFTSDGADPNRLVVNSNGVLNYYIALLDFNPFKGVPITGGTATIQGVAITYNIDRTTHGTSPGTMNVTAFDQVVSPLCCPRMD
jgi:hypothetical protein